MDSLVSTDWLEAELGAPDLQRHRRAASSFPPTAATRAPNMRPSIFPARSSSTSRRFRTAPTRAAHASARAPIRQPDAVARPSATATASSSTTTAPIIARARIWWMLRSFGAHYVALLDGGLQKWKAEGRPLESGRPQHPPRPFHRRCSTARPSPTRPSSRSLIGGGRATRSSTPAAPAASPARRPSRARASPPAISRARATCRRASFFNADNSWKLGDALRAVFEEAGVDLSKPMVTTCGSGITAAVLLFGAHLLGKDDVHALRRQLVANGAPIPARPRRRAPA